MANQTVIASITMAGVFGMLRTMLSVLNISLSLSTVQPATIDSMSPFGRTCMKFPMDSTFCGLTDISVTSASHIPSVMLSQLRVPYVAVKCSTRDPFTSKTTMSAMSCVSDFDKADMIASAILPPPRTHSLIDLCGVPDDDDFVKLRTPLLRRLQTVRCNNCRILTSSSLRLMIMTTPMNTKFWKLTVATPCMQCRGHMS